MAFLALLIGAVLIVAAIRNSHGALFSALAQDVPGFVVWGAAILALALIGYIPGLKPISRALLALVFLVIILRNYREILGGFESLWKGAASQGAPSAPSGGGGGGFDLAKLGESFGFDFSDLLGSDVSGGEAAVNG